MKACIFDLDGTLVNSIADLANATNIVLQRHHLPIYDLSTYQQFVGNGVKMLVKRALGDHQELFDQCLEEFYQVYEEHCLDQTVPYEGIKELLEEFKQKGVSMSVVTNKPHHLAIKIVEHFFSDTFVSIYGQQDVYPIKPNPESTFLAMMAMKCKKDDCYFVGDSNVDIETGDQAEIETIGVCWGFRGFEELSKAGANYIVDKPRQIYEVICK